jgi:hypothetical protein
MASKLAYLARMKTRLWLGALALAVSGALHAQPDTTRVLFLGNSYTYFNDLPGVLTALAGSLGHVVETAQNTPGGYSLQGHAANATSLDLIAQGGWDFVVLQEQSQKPAFPLPQVEADFFPAATSLVEAIRAADPCAIPLFYMTWGRENGDAANCASWPPVCTYEGMQDLLTERYLMAAEMNDAWCAPVGVAWRDLFLNTGLDFYNADGSHPSPQGTFVAASTMFVAMFGENPLASDYDGNIGAAEAQTVHQAVWSTWENDPEAWHRLDFNAVALSFSDASPGVEVTLSTGPWIEEVEVMWGGGVEVWSDGSSMYLDPESTTIFQLQPISACTPDLPIVLDTLLVDANRVPSHDASLFTIGPNPASDQFTLRRSDDAPLWIELWSMRGTKVLETAMSGRALQLPLEVVAGTYLLIATESSGRQTTQRIVVGR